MDFKSSVLHSVTNFYLNNSRVIVYFSSTFLFVFFFSIWYLRQSKCAIAYWPFLGNLPHLFWNSNRLAEWITQVFGSLNGKGSFFIQGPMFTKFNYLVTCDPRNIEYVLKTNFDNFPKGPDFQQVFDILGDGIFNVDSDLWRLQRKMAHANFASSEFRLLVSQTSRKIVEEQMVPVLAHVAKQESVIDLQDVFSRFAHDSSTITIFGKSERYLSLDFPIRDIAKAGDDAQEAVFYRNAMPIFLWKLLRWLRIGSERMLAEAHKTVDVSFLGRISEKREELLKGVETFDLLSSYIKSSGDKGDTFLRDAMVSLYSAGKDTITASLVWFFWLVWKTPRVKVKIIEELNTLLLNVSPPQNTTAKKDGEEWRPYIFDSEDLKGLVYLHAAICESLRLFPPLPVNSKCAVKEDVLPDGTRVKPGMQVLLAFYSVGRMPWIWGEDCLEFKPERWIDEETGKLSYEQSMRKFFAFNVGPRTCLGKDLTFTQLKVAIAAVLYNFHVEVVEGHHVCPKPAINLHMKNGLMVSIKKRFAN